ncbi:MAG: hypothetical protein HY668_00750 [Chloroflexi bacterium]|nr:hypothetical protein [Chloroflexota bacterium]
MRKSNRELRNSGPPESPETRQERREKKLRKKRERIQQHGKAIGKIYTDVVRKRAKK